MHDYLKVEFWNNVVRDLKSRHARQAETAIRKEIDGYLRDLSLHDAEDAVYHFGERSAADAIEARLMSGGKPAAAKVRRRKASA